MHPEVDYKSEAHLSRTKVYSRGRCRRMLNQLASVRLRTDDFQWKHWTNRFRNATENIRPKLGWYVPVFATK
jgi:hypothetical protein